MQAEILLYLTKLFCHHIWQTFGIKRHALKVVYTVFWQVPEKDGGYRCTFWLWVDENGYWHEHNHDTVEIPWQHLALSTSISFPRKLNAVNLPFFFPGCELWEPFISLAVASSQLIYCKDPTPVMVSTEHSPLTINCSSKKAMWSRWRMH